MQNKHRISLYVGVFLAVFLALITANFANGFLPGLISGLQSILITVVTALVLIFLMKHIMAFFEQKLFVRIFKKSNPKLNRILSLIISAILLVGFIVAIIYMFVPRTISILTELVNDKEKYIYLLQNEVTEILSNLFGSSADETVASITASLYSYIETTFNNILPQIIAEGANSLSALGQVFFGIIIALLYLVDREKVNTYVTRLAKVKMTEDKIARTDRLLKRSDKILIDFVIAKVIECVVLTLCLGIIMTILEVEAAFELAFIIGVLNIIPYVGFIIALVPLILITLVYGSVSLMLQAVIFVAIAYFVITSFITPFIVGSRVKINMIVMFMSLVIGGALFGMAGMLLGVPCGAIISEMVNEHLENKEKIKKKDIRSNDEEIQSSQNAELLVNNTENVQKMKTKTKKKKAEVVKENQEELQEIKDEKQDKKEKNTKKGKFSSIISKMKYNFSNISPEDDDLLK